MVSALSASGGEKSSGVLELSRDGGSSEIVEGTSRLDGRWGTL